MDVGQSMMVKILLDVSAMTADVGVSSMVVRTVPDAGTNTNVYSVMSQDVCNLYFINRTRNV
jgi:hypothetical protein